MAVASKNQFFNARIRGEDPANPAGPNVSDAFTGSGGRPLMVLGSLLTARIA